MIKNFYLEKLLFYIFVDTVKFPELNILVYFEGLFQLINVSGPIGKRVKPSFFE